MQGLLAARVCQHAEGERVRVDFQSRALALQESVRADVVFVGVGVDDARQRRGAQRVEQFARGVGAAAVYQEAVQEVGGRPVTAAPAQGPREIEARDRPVNGGFQHSGLSLPSLSSVVKSG